MILKKGNTYQLKGKIKGLDISEISKIVFQFNNVEKVYGEGGEVTYQDEIFTIPLSQEETLSLENEVEYEVAVKFNDNQVKRSVVKKTSALYTIIEEAI